MLVRLSTFFFACMLVTYGPTRPPVPACELALTILGFKDNDQQCFPRVFNDITTDPRTLFTQSDLQTEALIESRDQYWSNGYLPGPITIRE